jgi:hypothetical protein
MDRDGSVLRRIPPVYKSIGITTHHGDFLEQQMWPFRDVDGILMANSLHYVADQPAFLRACEPCMRSRHYFLIVEYDTDAASHWVPYPVPQTRLTTLFNGAGGRSIKILRSRPSLYRRAALYAALVSIRTN